MNESDLCRFAHSLPEVSEGNHAGCITLLVRGRRFATLSWPSRNIVAVVFDPDELDMLIDAAPEAIQRAEGAWGRRGHGRIDLSSTDTATVKSLIVKAWRRAAPSGLRHAKITLSDDSGP